MSLSFSLTRAAAFQRALAAARAAASAAPAPVKRGDAAAGYVSHSCSTGTLVSFATTATVVRGGRCAHSSGCRNFIVNSSSSSSSSGSGSAGRAKEGSIRIGGGGGVRRRWLSSTSGSGSGPVAGEGEADADGSTRGGGSGAEATEGGGGGGGESEDDLREELDRCQEMLATLKGEMDDLAEENKKTREKMLYTLSEAETTRSIAKRDVENAKRFSITSFAKSLLDVADNLHRAIDAVPPEEKISNPQLATLLEGVEMTEASLQKAFASQKLTRYGEIGDTFDPELHDAMFEYPDPSKEAGTIGQLVKPGYTLNDRVIRAANVGVVKKN